eukprot:CAMPEP_0196737666 /NCGR_PEP_ID=MMETSP1091-20130531/15325_1 /TAXON_ID=302021 /ORGANISM="Rhodomonas sp., Strain CCMP768" /LENGTH=216 /DNA_ID=CAMNT_0042081545 /DNA_START=91 /DNA_END=738 /DNA_ORIENTATION=+
MSNNSSQGSLPEHDNASVSPRNAGDELDLFLHTNYRQVTTIPPSRTTTMPSRPQEQPSHQQRSPPSQRASTSRPTHRFLTSPPVPSQESGRIHLQPELERSKQAGGGADSKTERWEQQDNPQGSREEEEEEGGRRSKAQRICEEEGMAAGYAEHFPPRHPRARGGGDKADKFFDFLSAAEAKGIVIISRRDTDAEETGGGAGGAGARGGGGAGGAG